MAVENEMKHSRDLFKNADGTGMIYFMRPCDERQKLRPLIEYGGGKVTSKVQKGSIKLAERGSLVSSDDYILAKFIEDCVKENKLLPMDQYRVTPGTRVRSPSGNSDSSTHSFASDDSMSPANYIVQTSARDFKGRSKYTKEEDIAMITFLIEEKRHTEASGIRVWKDMELHKVTSHSASSMNTRYRKHILPNIESYKYDVDRRWLSKLKGGSVVKEREPEFSAEALFAIKRKRNRTETSTTGKHNLTGGFGDVFDFTSDENTKKESGGKSKKQKAETEANGDHGNTELFIDEITENEEDKETNDTAQSIRDSKQDNKRHSDNTDHLKESDNKGTDSKDCRGKNANYIEKNKEDINPDINIREISDCDIREMNKKPLGKSSCDSDVDKVKLNELDTGVLSVSDIFQITDDDDQLEENVSGNELVKEVVEMCDGRLKLSQETCDDELEELDFVISEQDVQGDKGEYNEDNNGIAKSKAVVVESVDVINDTSGIDVEEVSSQVSENPETQPPEMGEICSNEVTSSGQCENENNLEKKEKNENLSDNGDDDSFDEMLKNYAKNRKLTNLNESDINGNSVMDSCVITVTDMNLSESNSQKDSGHSSKKQEPRKRKRRSENEEISSVREGKKRKLVAECKATCQCIAEKYSISAGFVKQLLYECNGDVDRTLAYIEYGPHSPDLPPWTEIDDKALRRNPNASGLVRKFGLTDVKNRHNFINYIT